MKFCPQNCDELSITEKEQDLISKKEPHICKRYGTQLKHYEYHPELLMLIQCDKFVSGYEI